MKNPEQGVDGDLDEGDSQYFGVSVFDSMSVFYWLDSAIGSPLLCVQQIFRGVHF